MLAIENQLGLKYFAGCREDHVGTRLHGNSRTVRRDRSRHLRPPRASRIALPPLDSMLGGFSCRGPTTSSQRPWSTNAPRPIPISTWLPSLPGALRVTTEARPCEVFRKRSSGASWSNGLIADFANSFLVVAALTEESLAVRSLPSR